MWKFVRPDRARLLAVVSIGWMLTSCGGGGGSSGGGGSAGGFDGGIGNLAVLSHTPKSDEVQVPVDTTIEVAFDGAIDAFALNEEEFSLNAGTESPLSGTFKTQNGGKLVTFTPDAPLNKATDYTFTLQPTLCDKSFRTLDKKITFKFRTFDDIAPRVTSASIQPNQTDVARTGKIAVKFDEAIAASSVTAATFSLKDQWGTAFPLRFEIIGDTVFAELVRDLPGSRTLTLSLRGGNVGVTDVAGNRLAEAWSVRFTTALDLVQPTLTKSDPAGATTDVSPRARLAFEFDESMDEASFEPTGVTLQDPFLNNVPFQMSTSESGKVVYLTPSSNLVSGDTYTVTFKSGATGMVDMSGNSLTSAFTSSFTVGTDTASPQVASSLPTQNETKISPNTQIELWFNERIKSGSVSRNTVTLTGDEGAVHITPALSGSGTNLLIAPTKTLTPGKSYTLRLAGGYDGVLDEPGNPLAQAFELTFTTSTSSEYPTFVVSPPDAASAVPVTSRIVAVASGPLDANTVSSSTFQVKTLGGDTVAGNLSLARGNRAIVFVPQAGLPANESLRTTLKGGHGGIRLATGNWMTRDQIATFRVGAHSDVIVPEMSMTINDIAKSRRDGIVVPPWGFTVDISAYDPGNASIDPSTLELTLSGPGTVPSPDALFGLTTFSGSSSTTRIDAENALSEGAFLLTAKVKDTTGNVSATHELRFEVASAGTDRRPFERTQIVWVQFDSDREGNGKGNGVADFDEDLINYGLMAAGDPIGKNARMRQIIIDGIIRIANETFHRTSASERKEGSVNIRLTTRQPCNAPHMKMAVGGNDPQGPSGREYSAESTGILGRALFDYRNSRPNENNAGSSLGLGVFSGELFLYQSRLFLDLYPYFVTRFGRTFRGLSPHMGGKPAGTDGLDATVLDPTFDYNKAGANERARYDLIMDAADNLAKSTGIILAHEIGHSVGLVATGISPNGLHGDQSLHNSSTGITDVMGAVIGYESLVTVTFKFRPLNLAYLRERVLLK